MHTYIYIYIHACRRTEVHACMHACMHAWMCTHTWVYKTIYMCALKYIFICVCMHTHICFVELIHLCLHRLDTHICLSTHAHILLGLDELLHPRRRSWRSATLSTRFSISSESTIRGGVSRPILLSPMLADWVPSERFCRKTQQTEASCSWVSEARCVMTASVQ